jgi:glycosyltransferase involved in cell wall biosynthesis
MKVINIPFCFTPDEIGGTEIYVQQLTKRLQQIGVDAIIAAPAETTQHYKVAGTSVYRYATTQNVISQDQLYGEGDNLAVQEFKKILDIENPDIVHIHAFTIGVSLLLIRMIKSRGIPVIFTYHTPTVSCQRGTMMLWGKELCDGRLDVYRCAACTLHGLGVPSPVARLLSLPVTLAMGQVIAFNGLRGRVWTALGMRQLIRQRHNVFREMTVEVDRIVAVCEWVRNVLLINDVPPTKILLSRQGIEWDPDATTLSRTAAVHSAGDELRIAFLGRMHPTKGVGVLIDALKADETLNVKLDIFCVVQDDHGLTYKKSMEALAGDDRRISFFDAIPSGEVIPRLRRYDLLAIPSKWLETGPLVALEAFAAGVPVIGWSIGGTSELVQNEVNGILIEPGPATAWTKALRRLANDAGLLARLKEGVQPPRNSSVVAQEMKALYEEILGLEKRPS